MTTASSTETGSTNKEQRREPRVSCHQVGNYVKSTSGENNVAFEEGITTALNRSTEGMLLSMPMSFEPGRILEVTFRRNDGPKITNILEVRWSKPSGQDAQPSQYLVGCRSLHASLY